MGYHGCWHRSCLACLHGIAGVQRRCPVCLMADDEADPGIDLEFDYAAEKVAAEVAAAAGAMEAVAAAAAEEVEVAEDNLCCLLM